jgi:hypothetical protein
MCSAPACPEIELMFIYEVDLVFYGTSKLEVNPLAGRDEHEPALTV